MTISLCLTTTTVLLTVSTAVPVVVGQNFNGNYYDRFTYEDNDVVRGDGFVDYNPTNWDQIVCDEGSRLDECVGYRDKWHTGRDWDIEQNYCRFCPEGDSSESCRRHHQSPINLRREFGYEPGTHPNANECIDIHWMKYEDSTCNMQHLIDADAFTIERHALRITQPISIRPNSNGLQQRVEDGMVVGKRDVVSLDCPVKGRGPRFGRIDYSKGFSQWWYLSHMDVHVPSEHHQEGFQYDAEIQLQHFYSATARQAGVNNEMGTIAVFMQAYDDAPPYRFLDKMICQWRRKEYEDRLACGLDPIEESYPGCFPLRSPNVRGRRQKQRRTTQEQQQQQQTASNSNDHDNVDDDENPLHHLKTFHDVILHNHRHRNNPNHTNVIIDMDESNWDPADESKDWDEWIQQQSDQMKQEDAQFKRMKELEYGGNHSSEELHDQFRKLLQYDELEYFNYWPMLGVRTEYYFRYSGSQTIPPCYGNFNEDSRVGTNHWRVMKDPIRIHPRQLRELERLVRERIAPTDDPVVSKRCQPDTAAKVDPTTGKVNAARPIQSHKKVHFKTYCECKDWPSKWPEDREYCKNDDIDSRFYDKPYNFQTDGYE
eukprot:CAMPEP_0113481950 /NCGR_PEP_ID=MMETSP0014_2-20120614/22670_1 /TAXON_ID=2857 /ORGANISM="Nitzschia sp." /LENGTH=597 /DNA_ID=CAMNT_0000375457 /DNA_START=297 /DNA_END=2090 /DNA_ORIENTATION=- /assembly_acc=CAM_ASM_000159